ncbi:MAG: FAD-dependent oxidoreductase [Streptosporangiales bacterium]|nr:FAD-dependent oxidoreductase [Streptosporangiales bacterium]
MGHLPRASGGDKRPALDWVEVPSPAVPVVAETDVVVAGGGSAGLAAAVAAARDGARTMLVERYGSLGGMATGGLVILLLTMDDGAGNQMVGGLCQQVVDRMAARGSTFYPPREEWAEPDEALVERYRRWGLVWGRGPHAVRYNVAYDPEEFRYVANELLREADVRPLLHTWVAEPVLSADQVTHLVCQNKAGREAIACKIVIDCTGDGDVFAAAGEEYEHSDCVPWLWFRMGGVAEPDKAINAAEGKFFPTLGGRFFRTPGAGRTLMPWGASDSVKRRIDATDPDELTWAELECRRLVMREVDRLREVPGFGRAYINDIAWQLGIYESRRLLGQHQLTREEEGTIFPDTVARTGNWTKYGAVYNIPLRSLLPQRVRNLLVAGRCISVDARVHHATKEIPPCMATGEAAGTAAALALQTGKSLSDIDVAELQRRLRERGAILP